MTIALIRWHESMRWQEKHEMTREALSSHASLVFVRAGLWPALFLITCVSVPVYLYEASAVIWWIILSSHASRLCWSWPSASTFLITCVPLSVDLSGAALVIWLLLLSSHLSSCHLMLLLSLLEPWPGHPMGQFDGVISIYLKCKGQTSKVHRVAMAS